MKLLDVVNFLLIISYKNNRKKHHTSFCMSQAGIEPATFRCPVDCPNHWATVRCIETVKLFPSYACIGYTYVLRNYLFLFTNVLCYVNIGGTIYFRNASIRWKEFHSLNASHGGPVVGAVDRTSKGRRFDSCL